MTFKKRYLRLVHLLFIVLLLIQLLPDKLSGDTYAQYVVWFAVGVEILTLIVSSFIKKPIGLTLFVDIVSFIYGLLIAWTLATAKFNLLKPALFPPPGRVFWQLIGDYEKIITNIFSSVGIILQGYLLAAASAIILGLLLGSSEGSETSRPISQNSSARSRLLSTFPTASLYCRHSVRSRCSSFSSRPFGRCWQAQ